MTDQPTYYIREGEHSPPMPHVTVTYRFGHTVAKCASDEGEWEGWQALTLAEIHDWENGNEQPQ